MRARVPSRGLLEAAAMLAVVRAALWCMPFPALRDRLARRRDARLRDALRRGAPRPDAPRPARIARDVMLASKVIPRSNCLVRALVAEQLLADAGHASELRLGVARGGDATLAAHAWIEYRGHVLVGGDISTFTALEPIEPQ